MAFCEVTVLFNSLISCLICVSISMIFDSEFRSGHLGDGARDLSQPLLSLDDFLDGMSVSVVCLSVGVI